VTTSSGAPEPGGIGFTGRKRDETGLHYHRHRYYQPELGRFISEDPLGFNAGDPNLYAYTFGDPVNHVDPDGQQAVGVGLGVCGRLGVAFGVAMDAWDDMMEIMDPDRGPQFGSEAARIALDRINRRLQLTMDARVTICSVSHGFSLPGFGGLATRGVGSATTAPMIRAVFTPAPRRRSARERGLDERRVRRQRVVQVHAVLPHHHAAS
jgi:RHS repeat-associated protein